VIEYRLDTQESKEFQEFDLKVDDDESWNPPEFMAKFLEKHFKRKNISRPSLQTSQNLNVMLYRLLIWTQRKRNESPKRAKTHTWVQKRPFISFRNNCFTAAEGNVIASHTAPTPKRLLIYQYSKDQTLLSDISCSHPGAIKRMGLPSRGEEG